jgi:choline dehydrogenase
MQVIARREVILSGGAIGSPQLLQVSGIGPAAVLKSAGVDVVHDLAGVGENLQDHYQARMMYEMAAQGSLNDVWHSRWLQFTAGLNYVFRRQGILTIGAGVVGAFTKSTPDLDEPDIQFHFIPLSGDGPGKGLHTYPGVIVSVCQLRPESRGHIRITSPQADAKPQIIANYLEAEIDQRVLLAAMHQGRKIVQHSPFKELMVKEHAPGPQAKTDAELMQFARDKGTTIFHPCGTAKMGTDAKAVVDVRLRVNGIANLRVVDASVMPTMTSGNTNAPTIMIAEKASSMILEDALVRA